MFNYCEKRAGKKCEIADNRLIGGLFNRENSIKHKMCGLFYCFY